MGELALLLGMDPPNVTTLVDDLQSVGLVQRQPHHADRRVMLVVATRAGAKIARQANDILERPPAGLLNLPLAELEELRRLLSRAR
jgi:DNA-binding MarR family transcriptional regulator